LKYEITYWNFEYLYRYYYNREFEVLIDYYYYHYDMFVKLIFHHIYINKKIEILKNIESITNRFNFCFFRCLKIIPVKQIRIIRNKNDNAPARIIKN
jgi:hypothetical protein